MRLIDADALREIVEDGLRNNPHKDSLARACHNTEYAHFLDIICRMPIISPPQNDQLTLEELREMDGEPVWVDMFVNGFESHWAIVHGEFLSDGRFVTDKERCLLSVRNGGYGKAWLAYRRKPEEGTNAAT